jgi:aminoglycoside 2'-N-acetyltransferase I
VTIRTLKSPELSPVVRGQLRRLLDESFRGEFNDSDWEHALGGWHVMAVDADRLVAHASIVPRRLRVGDRVFNTGYVEAVAVAPSLQRTGLGSSVMQRVNQIIEVEFELGALSTGRWAFYERLGWERWAGPSWVRLPDGHLVRSEDEDDGIMVLRCTATRQLDATAPITCEARAGDSW